MLRTRGIWRDLTGYRSGRLVAEIYLGSDIGKWECKCDCGNTIQVRTGNLTKTVKPTRSCGCLQRDMSSESVKSRSSHRSQLLDRSFGKLTVVEQLEAQLWLCQCECGKESKVQTTHLIRTVRPTQSCGCVRSERAREMQRTNCRLPRKYESLIGRTFGRLTVIEDLGIRQVSTKSGRFWKCECECGGSVEARTSSLQRKISPRRSCGCLQREYIDRVQKAVEERKSSQENQPREKTKEGIKTVLKSTPRISRPPKAKLASTENNLTAARQSHPASKSIDKVVSPEFFDWLRSEYQGMYRRCEDDNHPYYHLFGGSGIKMGWSNFEAFEEWILTKLGMMPVGTKLVRLDRYGNFEPGNLRWSGT
jgi:hypothetical protein